MGEQRDHIVQQLRKCGRRVAHETADRMIRDKLEITALRTELAWYEQSKHGICSAHGAYLRACPDCAVSQKLVAAETRAERAEAVVNQLLVTADGVPIVPGMVTYCDHAVPFPHQWDMRLPNGETFRDHCFRDGEKQYSTLKAARAAAAGAVSPTTSTGATGGA